MEKVNWQPATKENEFVNNMWERFDDAEGNTKDTYEISFEALDCFFRNVFRWLNSDTDVQGSVATTVDSSTADDKQKLISSNEAKDKEWTLFVEYMMSEDNAYNRHYDSDDDNDGKWYDYFTEGINRHYYTTKELFEKWQQLKQQKP